MRLPSWRSKNTETNGREDGVRQASATAWPDMFANLQSAYAELTNTQFELERRAAEIAETRDLFQQVVTSMTEAVFLTDRSGRVIRANPSAAALLGCLESSILGRPLTVVCGSDTIPATPWKLMEIAPTGRLANLEIEIRTMDGEAIPVSFSLGLMHDKQNKITGVLAVARDMREHRGLVNNLVTSRTRFQELVEFAPDAIVVANQEGRIALVNLQTEKLFGYRRDELLGQNVDTLTAGRSESVAVVRRDTPDLDSGPFSKSLGASEQFESVLADRSGREFQAEITRRRIETKDGIIIMSVIREMGEKARAGGPLRESDDRYRRVAETTSDVILAAGEDGRVIFVNSAVEKVFGYKAADVIGSELTLLMPDFMSRLREIARRAAEKGQKRVNRPCVELQGVRKGGKEISVEVSFGEYSSDGKRVFTGMVRDITERKRAEAARLAAEARYHELFDNANDIIYTCNLEGRFTSLNRTAERLTGYKVEDVLKMNIGQIVAPEYLELVNQTIADRIANKTDAAPYEIEIICADGSRLPFEVNARMVYEGGRPVAIQGIARDTRERRRDEQARRRLGRQAALRADISDILTSGDITLRQSLQKCAEALVAHLDAAFARIWLFNEKEQALELQASAGLYTRIDGTHSRVPLGKFMIGMIAEEKAPSVSNDLANDPRVNDREWAIREGMVSFAGYPLLMGDRVIGVIAMF
ncbi:MAG TPA: PAS domain S-box protein, partial [Blastocatellia bacterium]|nr:PAS domain S-box protein [Blastocatellia bacterium]